MTAADWFFVGGIYAMAVFALLSWIA